MNEWFNDSLKIHLIHYWMNQCFWMNLLDEWFNDSLKTHLFHYYRGHQVRSWRAGVPAEFSSKPNQTHLKQLIKVLTGILETSRQVCWGKLELNSAGQSSRIKSDEPCITGWISVFEWISWMNDSMTHWRFTRFITEWISVFEWISWMNDSTTHSRFTRFITEWISVFEWISWMNDSMTHWRFTRFITEWISVFEWISWMNDSMTHSRFTCFITEWISVFEWISWMNDSKTNTFLTFKFYDKYRILELELIFDSQP